jgi:hypothetical protein
MFKESVTEFGRRRIYVAGDLPGAKTPLPQKAFH